MKIKRYTVNHLREAMPMIRKDLGKDAVILNTKKIKVGGFLGFFQKTKLEVLAVLDEDKAEKEKKDEFQTLLESEKKRREQQVPEPFKEPLQEVRQEPKPDPVKEDDHHVMGELKSMKEMMMQLMETERLPVHLKPVNAFLEDHEFSKSIRSSVMADLLMKAKLSPGFSKEDAFTWMRQGLQKRTLEYPDMTNSPKKIRCFVGPTGVGKTTTIAKLAGDIILNERKSVGLITSDTYRIAAVDQLRTYADILGIPLEVVQSPDDLALAIRKLSECDTILMDTAGRNYQQYKYISQLEELVSSNDIAISLVLSLTHRYNDLKVITDNFQSVGVTEVILTKMDETRARGPIFNLMEDYKLPVTLITNGQNVPDDMLKTTEGTLVDLVMEEKMYGRSS
ncbi:flagellar biosynthesis protein FlhF [Alkalihalobacillus sp. CinArs1]|uniref:flagellar biosynthesis protein FlhF n=1 Tax=Alkalihalobacillus sp. CinArs1 TaxID=2995314 RepID=UPI0022DDB88B|nr:flagellar biosynthesis protein FlhF [Alkalihalobacillus sp. CinArs1]